MKNPSTDNKVIVYISDLAVDCVNEKIPLEIMLYKISKSSFDEIEKLYIAFKLQEAMNTYYTLRQLRELNKK